MLVAGVALSAACSMSTASTDDADRHVIDNHHRRPRMEPVE